VFVALQNILLVGCDGLALVNYHFLAAFIHPSLKLPFRSCVLAFLALPHGPGW
jgi:hypothetical protein